MSLLCSGRWGSPTGRSGPAPLSAPVVLNGAARSCPSPSCSLREERRDYGCSNWGRINSLETGCNCCSCKYPHNVGYGAGGPHPPPRCCVAIEGRKKQIYIIRCFWEGLGRRGSGSPSSSSSLLLFLSLAASLSCSRQPRSAEGAKGAQISHSPPPRR